MYVLNGFWFLVGPLYVPQTNQNEASMNNQSNCCLLVRTSRYVLLLNFLGQDGRETSIISRCFKQDYDQGN